VYRSWRLNSLTQSYSLLGEESVGYVGRYTVEEHLPLGRSDASVRTLLLDQTFFLQLLQSGANDVSASFLVVRRCDALPALPPYAFFRRETA